MSEETKSEPAPSGLIRADKVERAKELIADPNYPPREVLEEIAETLAQCMKPGPR